MSRGDSNGATLSSQWGSPSFHRVNCPLSLFSVLIFLIYRTTFVYKARKGVCSDRDLCQHGLDSRLTILAT
jgi:hypothetical protein